MDVITRLASRELSILIPEALFLGVGVDVTRPSEVQARLTNRCNYKCLQCGCWRMAHSPEMDIDQWKKAIASIREFLGVFRLEFIGGEPFVKKGLLDLLGYCHELGLDWGVATNGSAFADPRISDQFVAARPLKVNISVDGPTPEVHDRLRGIPGSLAQIAEGIANLRSAMGRLGHRFPIRIVLTLNALNFRHAPGLVDWVDKVGATSICINPMGEWTEESKQELWPTPGDVEELGPIIEELIRLKDSGSPIETPEGRLRRMTDHFLKREAPRNESTCRVGLRVFDISPNGIVRSCGEFRALGDLKTQSAREIWEGDVASEVRRQTVACTKGCTNVCLGTKTLPEKIRRGLLAFR